MLSKCANPACSAPFLYLHEGRLFRIEVESLCAAHTGKEQRKPSRRPEYFWLCDSCARAMTLKYKPGRGVFAAKLAPPRKVAS